MKISAVGRGVSPFGSVLVFLIIGMGVLFLVFSSRLKRAVVATTCWSRTVQLRQKMLVEREDWRTNMPSEQTDEHELPFDEHCSDRYDENGGYFSSYCLYSIYEWAVLETKTEEGLDQHPVWPTTSWVPQENQRITQQEKYLVEFQILPYDNSAKVCYVPVDLQDFQRFILQDVWLIKLNLIDKVEPVRRY